MEKINVAELIKECPKGMEFDCTICNNAVTLEAVDTEEYFPIRVVSKAGFHHALTREGCVYEEGDAKCVIFPKGKTNWEGFHRPFKEGDIIRVRDEYSDATFIYVAILKQIEKGGQIYSHCSYNYESAEFSTDDYLFDVCSIRFATEEEKDKLYKVIKDNGFKWNPETKTLEKLIEPKFKVGDTVIPKDFKNKSRVINAILDNEYNLFGGGKIPFSDQDNWELVLNKFDITTFKPFESRVLVRAESGNLWKPAIFGCYVEDKYAPYYVLGGTCWSQCIPYEGNEHLSGKTDDCAEFYKTWK